MDSTTKKSIKEVSKKGVKKVSRGHKKLEVEVVDRLKNMSAMGESKAAVKQKAAADWEKKYGSMTAVERKIFAAPTKSEAVAAALRPKIYSYKTFADYRQALGIYVNWCRQEHGCRTLEECRPYAAEWLQTRKDGHLSAWTLARDRSALAKVYQEPGAAFGDVPPRHRDCISRSRFKTTGDRHFSEEKNSDLVAFCRSTGLRRDELVHLRGSQLVEKEGRCYLDLHDTKGGRPRLAPVIGDVETVKRLCTAAGDGLVWPKVHTNADVHGYRAEYAMSLYGSLARPEEALSEAEKYHCRGDLKGVVLDRAAMKRTSEALGHSRIDVIANNYYRR